MRESRPQVCNQLTRQTKNIALSAQKKKLNIYITFKIISEYLTIIPQARIGYEMLDSHQAPVVRKPIKSYSRDS